jgi:AcrR family transcriptional regulator
LLYKHFATKRDLFAAVYRHAGGVPHQAEVREISVGAMRGALVGLLDD